MSGRNFDFVCVSAADIEQGETYVLYVNGEETASIEASDIVSLYGSARGMGGGERSGMNGMGRRRQQ